MNIAEHIYASVYGELSKSTDKAVWLSIRSVAYAETCVQANDLLFNQTRDLALLVGVTNFMSQYEYW